MIFFLISLEVFQFNSKIYHIITIQEVLYRQIEMSHFM